MFPSSSFEPDMRHPLVLFFVPLPGRNIEERLLIYAVFKLWTVAVTYKVSCGVQIVDSSGRFTELIPVLQASLTILELVRGRSNLDSLHRTPYLGQDASTVS